MIQIRRLPGIGMVRRLNAPMADELTVQDRRTPVSERFMKRSGGRACQHDPLSLGVSNRWKVVTFSLLVLTACQQKVGTARSSRFLPEYLGAY